MREVPFVVVKTTVFTFHSDDKHSVYSVGHLNEENLCVFAHQNNAFWCTRRSSCKRNAALPQRKGGWLQGSDALHHKSAQSIAESSPLVANRGSHWKINFKRRGVHLGRSSGDAGCVSILLTSTVPLKFISVRVQMEALSLKDCITKWLLWCSSCHQILKHKETVHGISTTATNEATLESMLQKVIDLWNRTDFRLVPHVNGGVSIIAGADDIHAQVEESLVTVATIRGSKYVSPIKVKCSTSLFPFPSGQLCFSMVDTPRILIWSKDLLAETWPSPCRTWWKTGRENSWYLRERWRSGWPAKGTGCIWNRYSQHQTLWDKCRMKVVSFKRSATQLSRGWKKKRQWQEKVLKKCEICRKESFSRVQNSACESTSQFACWLQVDKVWKGVMRKAEDRGNALRSATAPGILEMLQSANSTLEKIHKSLEVSWGRAKTRWKKKQLFAHLVILMMLLTFSMLTGLSGGEAVCLPPIVFPQQQRVTGHTSSI